MFHYQTFQIPNFTRRTPQNNSFSKAYVHYQDPGIGGRTFGANGSTVNINNVWDWEEPDTVTMEKESENPFKELTDPKVLIPTVLLIITVGLLVKSIS